MPYNIYTGFTQPAYVLECNRNRLNIFYLNLVSMPNLLALHTTHTNKNKLVQVKNAIGWFYNRRRERV